MDISSTYPDSEELQEAFNREFGMLRETMNNIESLFNRTLYSKQFISEEETAKILHCSVNEIPVKLYRYRPVAKRGYLYKLSEIYDFIESKRIGGK